MSNFQPMLIAAVDIGSPKAGNLGWALLPTGETGRLIDPLVERIAAALGRGPVALGFEAPMWVPARSQEMMLTGSRIGEGSRAWSAGAGAGVLATGLAVVPYLLARLRTISPDAIATMDWHDPPKGPGGLLLWEAFVSARDKGVGHEDDALIAARAFQRACADLHGSQKLTSEPCLNLLGAYLLRTGWSTDLSLLRSDVLVVRT